MRQFRDPIHGMIDVNEAELEIVNSRYFQRLRYIRQLGTSYLVYHGAEHTRFGHSLGVMHLVSRAMDVLKAKQPSPMPEDEFERLRQIVRIVALLHDIGHAPFSHVGENSDIFPQLIDFDGEKGSGHELYSRLIVNSCFKETVEKGFSKYNIKIEEILSFMKGTVTEPRYYFIKDLISGQLDMDRMDYLLRDSHYCGVKYGIYDLSRLLDTLTICSSPDGVWQLGIESDGVQAVEEFVFARYWMFVQVYFHKTRRIFDYFLIKFLKDCLPGGKYPENADEFIGYTDANILELMYQRADKNKWANHLYCRHGLKEVFVSNPHQIDEAEKTDTSSDYYKLGWIDEQFRANFDVDHEPENYYVDQANTSSAKEQIRIKTFLDEFENGQQGEIRLYAIPVRDKHTNEIKSIQSYSLPISSLSDKKINIIRIYANNESPKDSNDKTSFDKAKEFCSSLDQKWQERYEADKKVLEEYNMASAKKAEVEKQRERLTGKFK